MSKRSIMLLSLYISRLKFVITEKILKTGHLKIYFVVKRLFTLSGRFFVHLDIKFTLTHSIILHSTTVVAKTTIRFIL